MRFFLKGGRARNDFEKIKRKMAETKFTTEAVKKRTDTVETYNNVEHTFEKLHYSRWKFMNK